MGAAEERVHPLNVWAGPQAKSPAASGEPRSTRRVTLELLYDSEATLRLVDQELEELRVTMLPDEPVRCGASRLHLDQAEADLSTTGLLLTYWEIQDAMEIIRDSRASLEVPVSPRDDEHEGMSRALALLDTLHGEADEADARFIQLHTRLRAELLALARYMHQREERDESLHHTADALRDLEARLAQLTLVLDGRQASPR